MKIGQLVCLAQRVDLHYAIRREILRTVVGLEGAERFASAVPHPTPGGKCGKGVNFCRLSCIISVAVHRECGTLSGMVTTLRSPGIESRDRLY
jgi:hypothetical protein